MILRRLRYFATVAEESGISRAASRLFIAQPALTRQIHDLERAVGMPLFDRHRRGVQLTSAGVQLQHDVQHILKRLGETVRRVVLAHEGKLATLRLGLSRAAVDSRRVGRLVVAFREEYPDVELKVRELSVWAHSQALKARELDAAIGFGTGDDVGVDSVFLFEEFIDSALLATSHPLAIEGEIDPEQLKGEQLRVDSQSMRWFPALGEALSRLGLAWEELEGIETVFSYVATGNGWTVTLGLRYGDPPAGLMVRRIPSLEFRMPMMLRWRENEDLAVVRNLAALAARMFAQQSDVDFPNLAAVPSGYGNGGCAPELPSQSVEVTQLLAFVTTLNAGSPSAAAEQLGLTQSAVSRQITGLERAIGVPLISRVGGRVVPTAAGKVLHKEAPAIIELVDTALHRAQRSVGGATGRCVIGSISRELTNGVLVAALKEVTERYPEITITLKEGSLQGALLSGDIDVALVALYPGVTEDPSLATSLLQDDPLSCALVEASHPLAQKETLTPADLASEPLLFVSRIFAPNAYDLIVREMRNIGLEASLGAEYNGARAIWRAVASGGGWAITPRSLCAFPPPGTVARPVEGLSIPWGVGLQWRRAEQNPVVLRVVEVFRALTQASMEN